MKNNIITVGIGVIIGSIITSIIFIIITPTGPKDLSIVPEFDDVKNIVINGEKFTASQFADKYCRGKPKNTLKDESYCGIAIDEAVLSSMRSDNKNSIFHGRPMPQRMETPHDRCVRDGKCEPLPNR